MRHHAVWFTNCCILAFWFTTFKLLSAKVTLYSIRCIIFHHILSFFHSKSTKSIGKGNKMPKTFRIFAEILKEKYMKLKIHFSHKEELWNSWSHAGGILMGVVVGAIFLYWCFTMHNGWATAGIILYLFGMLMSYIASTVYHAISAWSKWKERLRKWDHAAIYWHIAGSYSPITLIALRDQGYWGWSLFIFIWACAIAGTIMSFTRLKDHSNLETTCFVGMGLSVLVAFKPLIDSVSATTVAWIIAEGVCYITGAVFYSINKKKYMHSVFHFFVLAGSIGHIIAVWDILMKYI